MSNFTKIYMFNFLFITAFIVTICSLTGCDTNTNSQQTEYSTYINDDVYTYNPQDTVEKEIVYEEISVTKLISDLNANVFAASQKYADKYLQITGKLEDIDSNGEYFWLVGDDEISIGDVKCDMEYSHVNDLLNYNIGDYVTVKIQITNIENTWFHGKTIEFVR